MSDPTQKQPGWLLPPQRKKHLEPGLYLVATPIGNLADITLRALEVLSGVDLVICEDTRVSGKLLNHYGIHKQMWPYNDHNAAKQRGPILEKLSRGEKVALISDAGTPLVSDPGYKLVQLCIEHNMPVTSLPGANAVLTALQLSGLPTDSFCFAGFLPVKDKARKEALAQWKNMKSTLIFYESAPRLLKSLEAMLDILGDREIAIARELTKLFEEVRRVKISRAIEMYKSEDRPKGEIVLVVHGADMLEETEETIESRLRKALETLGTREAAASVAKATGKSRKELYTLALRISENDEP